MRHILLGLAVIWAGMAQAWEEPARSTETRSALMDALRPHAEWLLGKPVEFVVYELRRSGDVAFGMVHAQRPGGGEIDLSRTRGAAINAFDVEYMDGSSLQALYRKSGSTWVAIHWVIGATDAWWYDPALCPDYAVVIPEACGG